MRNIRFLFVFVLCSLSWSFVKAAKWTTHFAYNNVTQIAMTPDQVYAISDGSLFSINKQSEKIKVYNRESGLHGTGILCIAYDPSGKQLIVCYGDGKMDLLTSQGVKYIGELYDKDMTQRKTIFNITISGRTAYLSTAYGVQTFDLRENKFVDSYWLRPGGQETAVEDVLIANDSIYAFTSDSLFCAAISANLVDYTFWKRELRSSRITPDATKGKEYTDATDIWYAGYEDGIKRLNKVTRQWATYKPEGPLVNTPYRLTAKQGQVWVVPGGRWDVQYHKPGHVMHYDGMHWTNIHADVLSAKTGIDVQDMMNTSVDPKDLHHYFVTSYGTGLYEFDHDTLVHHFLPGADNTLVSIVEDVPTRYTRLDYAQYDAHGRLWLLDAALSDQLQCMDEQRAWHAVNMTTQGAPIEMHTPGGLVIDRLHPNHKWIATARYNTMVCLLDDNGTPFDNSDDRLTKRTQWTNQYGQEFTPEMILDMMQDQAGHIWLATSQGVAYIDASTDYTVSDGIIQPEVTDTNGDNPVTSQKVNAICQTPNGDIWIGTTNLGIYILNSAGTQLIAQYTTDNSAMPSNSILSMTCDEQGRVWIGTAEGLVEYDPNAWPEGLNQGSDEEELEQGSMQQWRLHLSYSDATEVVATPRHIYAVANGSLFSFDREAEQIDYWSKATGLNGNTIVHIAYDPVSEQLVVAYEDGRIDLIDEEGNVQQIPDIYMKAGSIDVTINSICVGSRYVYLAMPFGIVALDTRKGEMSDTYYIGSDASSVDVQQIIEQGDTLYAFTSDRIYTAALSDNLVDYTYWHISSIPVTDLQQVVRFNNRLYSLQHDSLYLLNGQDWQQVLPQALSWIHESDGQLLVCVGLTDLYQLTPEDQLIGLTNNYAIHDALYSAGDYWLCEYNWGLIRLRTTGDEYYHTTGPNSNFGYSMTAAHDRIYSVIGGRWATEYARWAKINIYDGASWLPYESGQIRYYAGVDALDPVSIAVDPNDAGHYFVATYGTGVLEFIDYQATRCYTTGNSTLQPVNETINPLYYTRTDGAMIDEQGNLWVLNATDIGKPVHVMAPNGQWYGLSLYSGSETVQLTTPSGIWTDQRSSQRKWFFDQRYNPGVILLDDGGTPTQNWDDRCLKRNTFVDQNGNTLTPSQFMCFAQDQTNRIWIGTEKGLITIPKEVDFFSSNACKRIIIPRNDGTGLGDYLLGDEQINCLAVDGGNRLWIGTANSGLYLMEDDTITVAHFTETNSLLPSNSIQSITIMPRTGEVFVGTDRGIASYRSDASEPQATMSNAYAFPNPVRPDYGGVISITGLMDNTVVNIIDAGGNLVCKTRSHGGTAVWDGILPDGRRATPGVYTALCNAEGGHTVVKILVAY